MASLHSLLVALRDFYGRLLQRQEDVRTSEIIQTLRQVPAFQAFPRRTLRDIAEAMHYRAYKREEFIYYEQDPGLGLYIVQRGRVRLLVEDEEGGVHELRQVGPYEVFGDLAVLGDFRRLETAQAATETNVLGFFRPDLETLIKRNARAGLDVVAALARGLAGRQVAMAELLAAREEGKVAAMRLLHGAPTPAPADSNVVES